VPRSPMEVERAVRRELYGDGPTVGLTRTRRRPLDAREAEPLGQLFGGRYRVLERVGAGGMATVYRARDERLARDVAVKVMRERLARDPQLVRRFRREAQICGRLAHPNIVAVLDAAAVPRDFIVMELVDGTNAGTLLKQEGWPSLGEAAHVLAQVSDALSHVHDQGVVHQDVSPYNILIRSPDVTAKLADFGLASDSLDPAPRRETGGTPGYIAPEVLHGAPPSPRSDLYSLGVVAYRLLARSAAVVQRVPLVDACPGLPRALNEAVERALADDPDERQESVAEFRAELIGALEAAAA
jgi:serine/threonine protein kinase